MKTRLLKRLRKKAGYSVRIDIIQHSQMFRTYRVWYKKGETYSSKGKLKYAEMDMYVDYSEYDYAKHVANLKKKEYIRTYAGYLIQKRRTN